jgi:hypothetical protein
MNFQFTLNDPDQKKPFNFSFKKMKDDYNGKLMEAHRKEREKARKNIKASRKIGSVAISNTDSVERCIKVKARLNAKLGEIFASDLDDKQKMALARGIMLELNKVDGKIADIRRREKAVRETQQTKRKNETESERRRRKYDMEKRTITIRKDFLFHANQGGYDPNNAAFGGIQLDFPAAVAFDISGMAGEVGGAAADTGDTGSIDAVV